LLDDGLLQLRVESIKGDDVICRVVDGGVLRDKKGMNLPGSALSVPALTEKDKKDIVFGRELGVDWFALSFVRTPQDVREAKELAGGIPIIAKIEKPRLSAGWTRSWTSPTRSWWRGAIWVWKRATKRCR